MLSGALPQQKSPIIHQKDVFGVTGANTSLAGPRTLTLSKLSLQCIMKPHNLIYFDHVEAVRKFDRFNNFSSSFGKTNQVRTCDH